MHTDPYSTEPEVIEKIKGFIKENEFIENGLHHKIYLSDQEKFYKKKRKSS